MKANVILLAVGVALCLTPTCTRAQAQTSYTVAPASSISISGTSTLSNWVVRSQQVSGEMTFTGSIGPGTIKAAKAAVEVSSIRSEKGETMDNKMYNALKEDSHPEITFVLTKPIALSKAPARLSATGEVTIAGVTNAMTFELDLTYADNAFRIQGTRSLKLSDFNIEPPTAMFGQIETGDEIDVRLDLVFAK
jgi:polyisoprenoid-binding protein YceI